MSERKIIKDFTGGINRATDPVKMKDNEFYDFQNLIVYKLGSLGNAVKRNGIENWHSRSLSDTDKAMQLYQYISNSKTSNFDRLIVKSDSQLKYITTSGDRYTVIDNSDVTGKVKFLTFRDNLYITNRNTSGTYYTNKFYDGTNYLDMGLIPCPNTQKVTEIANGSLTALDVGSYHYLVTFVYDDIQESYAVLPTNWGEAGQADQKSDMYLLAQGGTIRFPYKTIGANKVIKLTDIPTGNARVTARRIYRTKMYGSGTSHQLYFLAEIKDNTTTEYIDSKDSDLLFEPLDLQARFKPPICKYAVQHKDRMFIANLKENLFTETPVITGLGFVDSDGGGSLVETKTYSYKFAFVYDYPTLNVKTGFPTQGFIGNLSAGTSHTLSTNGSPPATNDTITITGLDTANDYAKRVVVFRSKADSTSAYYPIGFTKIGATSYEDKAGDGDIELYKGALEQMGYEFVSTNKVLPSTLQFSDINYGDSFPPDNSIDVDSNDNDVITGLVAEDDGILIFKERNIYKLYTDREQIYWQLRKVVSNVGCDEPFSIVTIGVNTHLFMTNNEIWIYNNGNTKKISERIQTIIDGYTITNVDVCFHTKRNWVVYTIGHDSVNEIFILDLNFPQNGEIGSWYHFTQTTTTANGLSVRSPLSTKIGDLLFGNDLPVILQYRKSDAYVDYINNAGTATTANVSVLIKKYFDFDEWTIERLLAKINPEVTADADSITMYAGSTSTGSLTADNGRINKRPAHTGQLKTSYVSLTSTGTKKLEIKELGFDYIPKHEKRGSF